MGRIDDSFVDLLTDDDEEEETDVTKNNNNINTSYIESVQENSRKTRRSV
jgi:hypothetical protein